MPIIRTIFFVAVLHFLLAGSTFAQTATAPAEVSGNQIGGEVIQDETETKPEKKKTRRKKKPSSMAHFMRVRRDNRRKPVAFESSVTRYIGVQEGQKIQVDLIGVVHIGERDYYEQLNELFKKYDSCLLYTSPSPRDATLSRMPSSA